MRHSDLDRALCGIHRRQFQDGDKLFRLAIGPSVAAFRLGMPDKVKYFHVALPDGLSLENFMHWHALAVNRRAVVQVLNRELQSFDVFFIRHSV